MVEAVRRCYLCAEPIAQEDLDAEHVFPVSLFNTEDRINLLTLPSHRQCNRSYAADDEYFRLCMTAAAFSTPGARKLWNGPVLRGIRRPQAAGFNAMIQSSVYEANICSPSGDVLGTAPVMEQQSERIQRVVARMARGLYSHVVGDVLPPGWPVTADLVKPEARTDPGWSLLFTNVRSLGNGTVQYSAKLDPEDPREGFYWIVLYGSVDFWVVTGDQMRATLEAMSGAGNSAPAAR